MKALGSLNIGQVGVNPGNIQAYQAAIKGLSAEQAAYALATRGATEAQIEEIMSTETATLAKGTYTQADIQAALAKQGLATASTILTAEQQAEIVNSGLLTSEKLAEVAATIGLTTAEDGALVSKELLNAEMVKQQLTSIGVIGAQQEQVLSILGLTAAETAQVGVTNLLTGAWTALTTAIVSNPIGAVLVAATAAIVGVIAYTKHMANEAKEAEEALKEMHQEAESALNDSKSAISSTTQELSDVQSKLSSIKDEIAKIASKPSLTFVDKQQLDKLSTTEKLLKSQEQTLKNNLELQQKANANNAKELLKTAYTSHTYINETPNATWSAYSEQSMKAQEDVSQSYKEWYKTFKNDYMTQSYNQYLKAIESADTEGIAYWSEIVSANEAQIASFTNELYEIVANFQNDDGTIVAGYEDLYNEYMGYINDLQSLTNPEVFADLIETWSEDSDYDFESAFEQAIENVYSMDSWNLDDFKDANSEFVSQLAELGISDTTISAIFREKKAMYDSLITDIDTRYNAEGILKPQYFKEAGHVNTPEEDAQEAKDLEEYNKQVEKTQKIHDKLVSYAKSNPAEFKIIADTIGFDGLNKEIEAQLENVDDIDEAVQNAIDKSIEGFKVTESTATASIEDVKKEVESITTSISKAREVLNSQTTGKSISLEDFNSEELQDYTSALEYHNGVLQLNKEKVNELIKAKTQEQIEINNANKALIQSKYLENARQVQLLREKIEDNTYATDENEDSIRKQIDALLDQNAALSSECSQYDLMTSSLQEATSAYQNWLNAQNATQTGEMFDGALEALQKIDDTLNNNTSESYGRIGNEDYKAALEFIIPESVDRDDQAAINSYLDSVQSLLLFDKDGNYDGLNIDNFCKQALDAGLMTIDEESDSYVIAGQKTMQDFADGLELSLPLVQAMFGEMEEFGGEFDWADEANKTLGDMAISANEAAEALKKVSPDTFSETSIKIDVSDIEDSKTAIETLEGTITEMQNYKGTIDVDSEEVAYADSIIKYCVEQMQELSAPVVMDVDTSLVDGKLGTAIGLLQEYQNASNKLEQASALGLDTTEAQAAVDALVGKIQDSDNQKIMASLEIDTSSVDTINSTLSSMTNELLVKAGVDDSAIIGYNADDKEATVKYEVDGKEVDAYKPDDKNANVIYGCVHTAVDLYNPQNLEREVVYKARQVGTVNANGTVNLNGTAHASGTARANGDWGTAYGGSTLVGELGQEIVVDPHTGKWYTVGDNGAEFVDVPKGSIVFNHLQTQSLLNNGFVSGRGSALVNGTAMVTGGIKRPQAEKKRKDQQETKPTTDEKKSDDKKEKTVLEKFQEWFSKLFDWIEIKLQRQADKIEKYTTRADNHTNNGNYDAAAKNYRKAISATSTQISYEQTASSKYKTQANSVLKKAVSMGVVTQKQADTIAKRVKNGSMNISEYSDEIKEVIKDYQEWYDKSKDAKDAIEELNQKIRDYVKGLKDVRDTQRDAKLDSIDTYSSIGTSGVTSTSGAKNSQLNYTNKQLKSQNDAYNEEVSKVSSDTNSVGKTGTNALNKALKTKDGKKKKAYKKALNNAKKAIKAKQKVSTADLKTIKKYSISVYEKVFAYNLALDNLETAKLEQATNYAATSSEIYQNIAETYNNMDKETNDKISLLSQKAGNAYSTKSINKFLDQQASQYDTILKNDDKEIEKYAADVKSNKKTITGKNTTTKKYKKLDTKTKTAVKKQVDAAQKAAKAGKPIAASTLSALAKYYSKGYVTQAFYQACVDYNNALESKEQAKAQKQIDQQTAIAEKAAIAEQKMANIANKYNEKDSKTNHKISLYNAKSNNAKSAKEANSYLDKVAKQYDKIVQDDEKEIAEYSSAVNSNAKTIKNNAGTTNKYKKASKSTQKTVKSYIDKAKAAAKSGKKISDGIMDKLQTYYTKGYISSKFYDACVNYNAAIASKEEAEAQKEIDEQAAIAEKAAIGAEMVNNVEQEYTNKLNDNASKTRQIETKQKIRTTRGLSLTANDYKDLIAQSQADQSLYSQTAAAISQQIQANLAAGYWTTDSQEYKDAIQTMNDYSNKAEECKVEQEEWNNAIAEIPYTNLEKILDLLDAIKDNYKSLLSINSAKGLSETESQYLREIANLNSQIARYEELRAQAWSDYQKALNSADGVYGGKTADEWLALYYGYDTSINNLTADVVELNNSIANLPYETIEKIVNLLESAQSYDKSSIAYKSALGLDLDASDYQKQIDNNNKQIEQYQKERSQAYADYLKALSNPEGVYGGKTANEWLAEYNQFGATINGILVENEELKDSLRDDVYWRTFEKAHAAAQRFQDVLSGLSGLIDEDMYFDEDNNLTEYGVAQVANLVSEYENARKEVQNYQADIQNLNKLYAEGFYTEDEYTEKLNELQVGLLDSASSMKQFSDSIVDMYKNMAQAELDSLMDLIDARNDALSAKKAYYDYDKTIKDRTKDIQTLEAEIAALEGVETAQAKAKRATYEAQLAEAKEDLDDTINQHIFDLSQDALNELKNTLQDAFDDKWDKINANLDDISSLMASANQLTSSSAGTIISTMNKLLNHYGIDPVSSGVQAAYASGTRSVPKNLNALTNEKGNEIIVTKKGLITPMEHGEGVVPSYLTDRLYDLALNGVPIPNISVPDITLPDFNMPSTEVNQHYDSLINIEGSADAATVEDLKTLSKEILEKSYNYTTEKIYKGYLKSGGKRNV